MVEEFSPLPALLLASAVVLVFLVVLVVVRKARRDAEEAAAAGRRERYERVLRDGDDEALRSLIGEARRRLSAQRDLARACVAVDPLPPGRLDRVHRELQTLVRTLWRRTSARDPVVRGQAMLVCARLRVPGADELVAPMLRDPDPDVRLAACGALDWLATEAAALALIGALSDGVLAPERLVERLGRPWAADAVITALLTELIEGRPSLLRAWLARALGLAGVAKAQPVLLALLRAGDDEERISAARALGTCGTSMSVDALARALTDPEWTVRGQAARALGMIGDSTVVGALATLLGDRAWWVRASAAGALRNLGGAGHAALTQAAAGHSDQFARDRAHEALALERVAQTGIAAA